MKSTAGTYGGLGAITHSGRASTGQSQAPDPVTLPAAAPCDECMAGQQSECRDTRLKCGIFRDYERGNLGRRKATPPELLTREPMTDREYTLRAQRAGRSGRPPNPLDPERCRMAATLRADGMSWRQLALTMGVARRTVIRMVERGGG